MIGVKLTCLAIVLTVILFFVIKIASLCCSNKTKLKIVTGKSPIWYTVLTNAFVVLVISDVLGILWTVVWFLFLI